MLLPAQRFFSAPLDKVLCPTRGKSVISVLIPPVESLGRLLKFPVYTGRSLVPAFLWVWRVLLIVTSGPFF